MMNKCFNAMLCFYKNLIFNLKKHFFSNQFDELKISDIFGQRFKQKYDKIRDRRKMTICKMKIFKFRFFATNNLLSRGGGWGGGHFLVKFAYICDNILFNGRGYLPCRIDCKACYFFKIKVNSNFFLYYIGSYNFSFEFFKCTLYYL